MEKFYLHLKLLELNFHEYRYIILEFIYGKFIFLINDEKYIFFKNNLDLSKSKFFLKSFNSNKYYIRIPNYIKLYPKYINLISLLQYNNAFYFNHIKNLTYFEFKEFIVFLDYLDLLKNDKYGLLKFYKETIELTYDLGISNCNEIKVGYLINMGY